MTRLYLPGACFSCLLLFCIGCGDKPRPEEPPHFTRADSVMDTYLSLQDSMLWAWNVMMNDDNRKIRALQDLLHELTVGGEADPNLLKSYEERVNRLRNLRFTQKTMANPDIITEYDFATEALVRELISLAEAQKQFGYNPTLQKLVDAIRIADRKVTDYRASYDEIALRYNDFVSENREFLKETNSDSLKQKPLFQVAADR